MAELHVTFVMDDPADIQWLADVMAAHAKWKESLNDMGN